MGTRREASAEFAKNRRVLLKENEVCQLCGKHGALEVHHIVPESLCHDDSIANLIVICPTCHAKLTPKSVLTKIGIQKVRNSAEFFYRIVEEKLNNYDEALTANDIMDVFDEWYLLYD